MLTRIRIDSVIEAAHFRESLDREVRRELHSRYKEASKDLHTLAEQTEWVKRDLEANKFYLNTDHIPSTRNSNHPFFSQKRKPQLYKGV